MDTEIINTLPTWFGKLFYDLTEFLAWLQLRLFSEVLIAWFGHVYYFRLDESNQLSGNN